MASTIPVFDIGGTHLTAALVTIDGERMRVARRSRIDLDAHADAREILRVISAAGRTLGVAERTVWGVAVPGPFDYTEGIGRFRGVGKFGSLDGVDVGRELRSRLKPAPTEVVFVNDADAYGLGEWTAGAGRGHARMICLTLGTGVGSAFLDEGRPVDAGDRVPPNGDAYLLEIDGRPLEDSVSRRAIRLSYRERSGDDIDVHEIAAIARRGDATARSVLDTAMTSLGRAIAPFVRSFEASVVVVGGSISGSWDLIERPLRDGLGVSSAVRTVAAGNRDDAPLLGAAEWARRVTVPGLERR